MVSNAFYPNRPFSTDRSLTVSGLQFMPTDPTATVESSLASCPTAAWTSTTSAVCLQAAAGTPGEAYIVLTMSGGYIGTGVKAFSFDGIALSLP